MMRCKRHAARRGEKRHARKTLARKPELPRQKREDNIKMSTEKIGF
jgi:hypothetical protein